MVVDIFSRDKDDVSTSLVTQSLLFPNCTLLKLGVLNFQTMKVHYYEICNCVEGLEL